MSTYLVTGATGGLGREVVEQLEYESNVVVSLGRRDVDFDDPGAMTTKVLELAEIAGGFKGIVHCAGAEVVKPLRLTSNGDFEWAMTALVSTFAILRAAATKGTMEPNSSVVLISSVSASVSAKNLGVYAAAKAGIESLCRTAAAELASKRIRVNAVAPGAFASPMHSRIIMPMTPDAVSAYNARHPLGIGSAQNVADAVTFLLSNKAEWITGTTMRVDGGFSL